MIESSVLIVDESSRRVNMRVILSDKDLKTYLINGAVDFICKVEHIRSSEQDTL